MLNHMQIMLMNIDVNDVKNLVFYYAIRNKVHEFG